MRRLLGVLRSDQPAERAPQPGLPDLPGLIDTARQAGMTVELSAPAAPDQVPPSTGVCAYRIIQEALSNAGRHAVGRPGHGIDAPRREHLTLQVVNGPGVPSRPRANGSPARPRPRRDAGTGRTAGRLAGSRPGARRRVRGIRGTPAQRISVMTPDGSAISGRVIRCLIADDQAMVREGFAAMLAERTRDHRCRAGYDGADAVRQARQAEPRRRADGRADARHGRAAGRPPDPHRRD